MLDSATPRFTDPRLRLAGGAAVLVEFPRFVVPSGSAEVLYRIRLDGSIPVVALSALNGRFRMVTTVDLTSHFIRSIRPGPIEIRVDVLQNGRRMAYTRVEMRAKGDARLAMTATGAFAYLED
jgi:hypothetical protein